jgi:hypothetical protein
VSFIAVPLIEIGPKATAILALGWRYEETLPEKWTVKFSKLIPPDAESATADQEIRELMGDYWCDP